MKIKLDENLPDRLVTALTDLGHDVDTVVLEHLAGQADPKVWQAGNWRAAFSSFKISISRTSGDAGHPPRTSVGPPSVSRPGRLARSSAVFVEFLRLELARRMLLLQFTMCPNAGNSRACLHMAFASRNLWSVERRLAGSATLA